jgi:flotillin
MASYRIAAPDEYLAITGMGVKNVKITKAAWVFPFQRCMRFSVQPHDYGMNLQAMTKEKLQFLLPVVFTIGPDVNQRGANTKGEPAADQHDGAQDGDDDLHDVRREDRGDSLMKYAMLLADSGSKDKDNTFLENIVKGIIEGETRVLVSSMTMEEIFTEREVFKRRIFRNIQSELDQFGLKIYNANVKELKDAPNSIYFESLSRKAHEGATNQARIDVAAAQLRGNVGEAQRKGEQDREIAKINAETAVQKTERDIERAQAEAVLATRKTELNRDVELSRIAASRKTEAQDEELKKEVEIKRAAAEVERLRATDVVKATIAREAKQQAADAHAYEIEAEAKANFERQKQLTDAGTYKMKVETDAAAYKTKTDAEAFAFAAAKKAEADLQLKLREAEGLAAMAEAYAKMGQAFGGPAGLMQYMMIEKGTYVELAKANGAAIKGLQPKISIWNTGAEAGTGGEGQGSGNQSSVATMRNIYQMLPPLMSTINEQTGITLPEWQFGTLANATAERAAAKTNGKHIE